MTTKTHQSPYRTTFHHDGTVTYWSVFEQGWKRCAAEEVSDETLATLPAIERDRIVQMATETR